MNRSIYKSDAARRTTRTRRFSASDSDKLEEKLKLGEHGTGSRRFSLTGMLLGQRSLYNANESVIVETVKEVSETMENIAEEPIVESAESSSEVLNEALSQKDGNGTSAQRKVSYPDQFKSPLLDTLLSSLSSITGIGTPGTVYKGSDEQENSGEYNAVYSDDFLVDRMYRRMNSRKKEKN